MKNIFAFLIIVSTCFRANAQYEAQIKSITQEIGNKVAETGKKRIAVADFMDANGVVTKLGQFLSEEFNTALPEYGQGFQVIDRSRLNDLMRENKLGSLTDPKTAVKLGELAGIEALIYGTITPLGESVRVNIKILDIQRAVILRALAGNITRTADINGLLAETISNVRNQSSFNQPLVNSKTSSPDCAEKRTCTVCVTNKSGISVEASGFHSIFYNRLLVHPNTTKCWQEIEIPIGQDYFDSGVYILNNGNTLKENRLLLEPCQVFSVTYTK